ncbi:hypothetical protein [Clostridium intestinale]|uniref:Uncharacterized protein n=1 Tax=Clostridium intestinale URNW TaxID=1294142 RepID=U2N2J4_9CLOT|nr:hypothetical protein [Clostridium intestinale]ERK29732.1 hypothetical protein CINTURNW_2823 [Clostridium intestinale URNW]
MEKIFQDENKNYSFDFTDAEEVLEPHNISQKTTMLADVDFVLDTKDKIIFLEYKNASTKNANNPSAFKEKILGKDNKAKFYENISKKFYSSLFIIWACNKNDEEKDIEYLLLIEHPEIDGKIRRILRNKIAKQLPFKLLAEKEVKRKILSEFKVINIEEWHSIYPEFKITEI